MFPSEYCVKVRALIPERIHDVLIQRWLTLLHESHVANIFLSPEFVLSYVRNFRQQSPPNLLTVENRLSGEVIGLGIFDDVAGSKLLPLPHLVSMHCPHQYREGLLISRGCEESVCRAILTYLNEEQDQWFGIEFRQLNLDEIWTKQLQQLVQQNGCSFQLQPHYESPAINLQGLGEQELESLWSSSRRKSIRRNRNRLEKQGHLQFHLIKAGREIETGLRNFLELENASWKGELGTSLLSDPAQTAFIRQFVRQAAAVEHLLISELRVGTEVAAAAVNFCCRDRLFAFKIGWNEKYADASPGMLHEIELINAIRLQHPEIRWVDSCAQADSYLKSIWPDRLAIGTGLLTVSSLAQGTGKFLANMRRFRNWARELMTPAEAVSTAVDE